MARHCLALWCLLASAAVAAAEPLDPLLTNPSLWTMKQADFETAAKGMGFQWVSAARDSARAARPGMSIFGMPAVEAVARFDAEKLKEITVAIYARGDAGGVTKDQYNTLVSTAVEALSKTTGVKFTARGKDATNAVKADGVFWSTPQAYYLLEYSATKEMKTRNIAFRAEFVRLEITPPAKTPTLISATKSTLAQPKFFGAQHVKKDAASGDVVIDDVPMVDQGQKGYCVVAATERVMRYYGGQVDANELAQIANSDAEGGTSYNGMIAALKKVSARLKVRVRQHEESSVKGILEMVKDYNRAAKKAGASEIADPGHMIDVAAIYQQVKPAVLKDARTKSRADLGRFQREVQQHIDQGIPMLWSVQLGLVPEPGIPQNAGGHMRLIIGYNTKTSEIMFSDSWGAGHEQKRMPLDDAWTITTGLATIEPL
ncbi:MAG: hypothetical protein QOE70_4648 [Chthoniobacter sp.]|jgi:hypothetical protein|nr:hypothetical protein [Chthoniobacter sp.]